MLAPPGIIAARRRGRDRATGSRPIAAEIEAGAFTFSRALEDIHMNVESRLARADRPGGRAAAHRALAQRPGRDRLPALGARRHRRTRRPARRAAAGARREGAGASPPRVMPGFTHLQPAQPVTFGHHLLAYVEMLGRDRGRFADARRRLNECPLGAAALAGTSFPIDRDMTAEALGFDRPTANSLDCVSDRDFALEALAAASICAVHLSRFAEEIVLWTTPQFGFVAPVRRASPPAPRSCRRSATPTPPSWCAPRPAASSARCTALLVVMKGLPLAYSKDMQEDKEGAFDAFDALSLSLAAMAGMVARPGARHAGACARRPAPASPPPPTSPTGWCGRSNLPFREAHHVTGRLVGLAAERKASASRSSRSTDMQAVEPRITRRRVRRCSASSARSAAARATAAPRPPTCARRRSAGSRASPRRGRSRRGRGRARRRRVRRRPTSTARSRFLKAALLSIIAFAIYARAPP